MLVDTVQVAKVTLALQHCIHYDLTVKSQAGNILRQQPFDKTSLLYALITKLSKRNFLE